ncbi:MAG: tetratricopeptide repeat protein [Chitinophagaceae bacterium]|nr:tetratricopeptide repeat protein [Chitinophagaceae bacterium]
MEKIKYDSAKKYFRRALFVRPNYKPASKNLMLIFKELNQLIQLLIFLKGSSLFDPGSTLHFMNDMGLAFLDQKRYDSARWYIRKAIMLDPVNPAIIKITWEGCCRVRNNMIQPGLYPESHISGSGRTLCC